jgi:hypothetical protein
MSNATPPLMSLGDSLDSLLDKMSSTDNRRDRVLADHLAAYARATSIEHDVDAGMLNRIIGTTHKVAILKPSQTATVNKVLDAVEALLLDLP